MAQYQNVGDETKLSQKPVSSPSSDPSGGDYQLVGDTVEMSRKPIASPSANPKGGEYQNVGDGVDMSRTPQKGWGSAAKLPMSERSIAQSKGSK